MAFELQRDDIICVVTRGCFSVTAAQPVQLGDMSDEAYGTIKKLVDALQGPKDQLEMLDVQTSDMFRVSAGRKGTPKTGDGTYLYD
jgi:hypothetical protein